MGPDSATAHKKKIENRGEDSRRESSSSVHRLPIGVGDKLPPVLFKEEIPPLSFPSKISRQNGGNRRKFLTETHHCDVQFLAGKASSATEVSLLPFLSPSPSFPCRRACSPAIGFAGFCCEKKSLFLPFSVAGGHRRPPVWPPLAVGSPLLWPPTISAPAAPSAGQPMRGSKIP